MIGRLNIVRRSECGFASVSVSLRIAIGRSAGLSPQPVEGNGIERRSPASNHLRARPRRIRACCLLQLHRQNWLVSFSCFAAPGPGSICPPESNPRAAQQMRERLDRQFIGRNGLASRSFPPLARLADRARSNSSDARTTLSRRRQVWQVGEMTCCQTVSADGIGGQGAHAFAAPREGLILEDRLNPARSSKT